MKTQPHYLPPPRSPSPTHTHPRNYLELQHYLTAHFPDLKSRISGSVDQPPEIYILLANITSMLQIFGMAFFVFGDGLLSTFGITSPPKWLESCKENKMLVFFGLFMLNTYANSFMATGAFEVEYNGVVVYSKIERGRMPSVQDVVSGIEQLRSKYAMTVE